MGLLHLHSFTRQLPQLLTVTGVHVAGVAKRVPKPKLLFRKAKPGHDKTPVQCAGLAGLNGCQLSGLTRTSCSPLHGFLQCAFNSVHAWSSASSHQRTKK